MERWMPFSAQAWKIAAAEPSAWSHASVLPCWEPTWGHAVGSSDRWAVLGTSTACRLRSELARSERPPRPRASVDSGSADTCTPSTTGLRLGAAIFSTRPSQSTAGRAHAELIEMAAGDRRARLLDGVAEGERFRRWRRRRATSIDLDDGGRVRSNGPARASSRSSSASGFALHRVEDAGVGQGAGELEVVLTPQNLEVEIVSSGPSSPTAAQG